MNQPLAKLHLVSSVDAPKNPSPANGCDADEIIADAHAFDHMREELFTQWSTGGRHGINPEQMQREQIDVAYRELVARQRVQDTSAKKQR